MLGSQPQACPLVCRYTLLLCIPGAGEQAILSGTIADGIQTEEAKKVEDPMFEELGLFQSLQKPGALTAAINWYRYAPQVSMHMVRSHSRLGSCIMVCLWLQGKCKCGFVPERWNV